MPINPNDRITHWSAKYKTDRVKESLDNQRDRMLARYADVTARLCAMELGVKKLLDAAGVQTILYVSYLNYGRQLFKLSSAEYEARVVRIPIDPIDGYIL